jgi:hypothetical protein
MQIRAAPATTAELAAFGVSAENAGGVASRALARLPQLRRWLTPEALPTYTEPSFAYDASVHLLRAPVYLNGYWQSERYFADIADQLRQDFTLRAPPDAANAAMLAQIQAAPAAVSLHVRRGDYVSNPTTAQYHGVCSLAYYHAAIDYIAAQVAQPHYFLFTDDPAWVADNLKSNFPTTLVQINSADRGMCDMALMRACRHHIIANSSFSWWGAWLNPAPDKLVVAPQKWFSGAGHSTADLVPASWVRL